MDEARQLAILLWIYVPVALDASFLSAHRAGSVREGLWTIGEMVVDDLEAIVAGLPPQRLQVAQPELAARYASNAVPSSAR